MPWVEGDSIHQVQASALFQNSLCSSENRSHLCPCFWLECLVGHSLFCSNFSDAVGKIVGNHHDRQSRSYLAYYRQNIDADMAMHIEVQNEDIRFAFYHLGKHVQTMKSKPDIECLSSEPFR